MDPETNEVASQYTMNYLEKCGLIKFDFLGIKTIDVIKHAEELIRHRGGEYANFTIKSIPESDEATFKMLGKGESYGVFQFESEGMQNILKQFKPSCITDLIALTALYRPGSMDSLPGFIVRKWGRQPFEYPHPNLEDILKETYGIIIYQEQVMQIAHIVAGYSLGRTDLLRRMLAKKNSETMAVEKQQFISNAIERGYSEQEADKIFENLISIAAYAFNKSHSAAYALLAYQTAYLKANFPAEFMAVNMPNEADLLFNENADALKLLECIAEARKLGIIVDPPDINRTEKSFTVENGHIVCGFFSTSRESLQKMLEKYNGDLFWQEWARRSHESKSADIRDVTIFGWHFHGYNNREIIHTFLWSQWYWKICHSEYYLNMKKGSLVSKFPLIAWHIFCIHSLFKNGRLPLQD
jgi:DNA polymerase-3 subunit alpha